MSSLAHGNSSGQRLVIFGCGYVGRAVAEVALARGITVTALTRNASAAAALRAEGIATVVADLATDAWHREIGGRPEFALNCVSSGGAGVEGYRESYLAGMESIVAWARSRDGAGTFVYTSSTSVYSQDGGVRVDEKSESESEGESANQARSERVAEVGDLGSSDANTIGQPHRQGDPRSPTSATRPEILRATERCLVRNGEAFGRWFILRLAGIYGPGRHHLLEQVRTGVVAGNGDYHLNLAHRDDIAAAIWACFTAPPAIANEVFNVADDGAAPKREIVNWLATRLGVPPPKFTGAPAAGRRLVTPDRIITNDKLKCTLGWQPHFPTYREGFASQKSET